VIWSSVLIELFPYIYQHLSRRDVDVLHCRKVDNDSP
jgi:hypothetical protein